MAGFLRDSPHARTKTRVLLMPEGSVLAHVGRSLALASELHGPGVEVLFASSGAHASHLAASGLPLRPVTTLLRSELMARLKRGGSAFDAGTLAQYIANEIELLEELQPDCVVGDFRPSLGISAKLVGIPYVCITNAIWTRHCDFELAPPKSWLPSRIFGDRLLRAVRPMAEPMVFRWYARPFNVVRRHYGLAPQNDLRDCMCSEDLTLIADAPKLFPTRKLPDNFRMIGPIIWEPNLPEPRWLPRLRQDISTVYLTMGSTGPLDELQRLSKAMLDRGLQVVCTTATRDPGLWPESPLMFAARYAPGSRLCAVADAVVCHAGNGTIYQALSQGTPVVGLPDFHDQEFNMQRVEEAGVGCRLDTTNGLARGALDATLRVLSDGRMEEQADQLAAHIRDLNGARCGAQQIRRMVGLSVSPCVSHAQESSMFAESSFTHHPAMSCSARAEE